MAVVILFVVFRYILPSDEGGNDGEPTPVLTTTPEPTLEPTPTVEPTVGIETYQFPSVIGHKLEDAKAAILCKGPYCTDNAYGGLFQ